MGYVPDGEENRQMQMVHTKAWTLEELDRLPDDGNKYELVRGELFVSPAPSVGHESLVSLLRQMIEPYVIRHGLGRVFGPRAVVRARGSEVEPDLMVRPLALPLPDSWADAPLPILVVETLSNATRRRDHGQKRDFYLDLGIAEYWIVDGEHRTIRVIRPGHEDVVADVDLIWHPEPAPNALVIDVRAYFRDALGGEERKGPSTELIT